MRSHADPRQAAVAEADMVAWLAYPTELGDRPHQIELLRTIESGTSGSASDLYVFRFRVRDPHWAANRGWMIGVAGPYLRSQEPTPRGLGFTFSRLEREDAMPIEEHVTQLVDTVARWAEHTPNGGEANDE